MRNEPEMNKSNRWSWVPVTVGSLSLFVISLWMAGGLGGRFAAPVFARTSDADSRPRVVRLEIKDEIEPILAEYINNGMDHAAQSNASLVLITMDTPGGLSDSMEQIIQHILHSPVPVAIYIEPAGSRGASAGFFILLSADIAAMAPGTHTGAASPVLEIGGYQVTVDETMKRKILNDATAFLRSYASAARAKRRDCGDCRYGREGVHGTGSAGRETGGHGGEFGGGAAAPARWAGD